MFTSNYAFKGIHAKKVKELTAEFDNNKNRLFNRMLDVYIFAPVIGILYGEIDEIDNGEERARIFVEQLIGAKDELKFNFRLITLLSDKLKIDFNEKIDIAFRYLETNEKKESVDLYNSYVLGGVNIIYDKLINNDSDQFIHNLYDFLEEINDRYNKLVSEEGILDLCKLARD